MIKFEDYCKMQGVSKDAVYKRVQRGSLVLHREGGENYIVDVNCEKLTNNVKTNIVKDSKEQFNTLILRASIDKTLRQSVIEEITRRVFYWKRKGVKIHGYSSRAIYRKIDNPGKLRRKTRNDAGVEKNTILCSDETCEKILSVAVPLYINNAKSNVSLTAKLVKEYAQDHEEFWEIADEKLPFTTLYTFLKRRFDRMGTKEMHQYLNHNNLWFKKRVMVTGAFTDDIEFMDYIAGDDHEFDFFVNVWNPHKKVFESKKPRIWSWRDAKTMKVLGYTYTTESLKAIHLQTSLAEAVMQYGLPKMALSLDNGIGKSDIMYNFYAKLGINTKDGIKRRKPYNSTGGATIERGHGLEKDEWASFERNFIGDYHKKEGRHPGLSLTPDKPLKMADEVAKQFEQFIFGKYETRVRDRVIDGKKYKISIRDYFAKYWMNYEPLFVKPEKIRSAFYSEYKTKKFNNFLMFKGEQYQPIEYMGPVFNFKKYEIKFNPADLNEIDLVADEVIINESSSQYFEPGDKVMTLICTRNLPKGEKAEKVNELNRASGKHIKKLAEVTLSQNVIADADLEKVIHTEVGDNGIRVDMRKKASRRLQAALEESVPVVTGKSIDELRKPAELETDTTNDNAPDLEDDEMSDDGLGGEAVFDEKL